MNWGCTAAHTNRRRFAGTSLEVRFEIGDSEDHFRAVWPPDTGNILEQTRLDRIDGDQAKARADRPASVSGPG
jgi:hypothetical protein